MTTLHITSPTICHICPQRSPVISFRKIEQRQARAYETGEPHAWRSFDHGEKVAFPVPVVSPGDISPAAVSSFTDVENSARLIQALQG
jgi:hypothetical protein